jgi:hypothetical protein
MDVIIVNRIYKLIKHLQFLNIVKNVQCVYKEDNIIV